MHMNPYDLLMIVTFIIGYVLITVEHVTKINKTSIALMMAILCWIFQFGKHAGMHEENLGHLSEHLANISQIVFFLLGALTIVEIINAHEGFQIISRYIHPKSKKTFLWVVGGLAFVLSGILDNLTTTIILITLVKKLIDANEERLLIGGAVVIAANAGGAWTPIGDVTTTMLWIGGQVTTVAVMRDLVLPSITCMVVAFLVIGWSLKGEFQATVENNHKPVSKLGKRIFFLGLGVLVFVPIFKLVTGLPPFMGIIFGLSVMWLVTDWIHGHESTEHLKVPGVMSQIDFSSVLFFLGILLAIDALHTAGILHELAGWMSRVFHSETIIAIFIGLASAVVDNVPLVAASMGMYDLATTPTDSNFWELVSYCAGTGGSILVIGSAAGVAFMGMEKVEFFWYFRRVGIPALIGYFAGIGVYLVFNVSFK